MNFRILRAWVCWMTCLGSAICGCPQTFTALRSFTGQQDGGNPDNVSVTGSALFGTASGGGDGGNGTVFQLESDGTGFGLLYTFAAGQYTNSDGLFPRPGLILIGSTLYGITSGGGAAGFGTVFAIDTNGSNFRVVHDFAGSPSEGANPYAGLVASGDNLFGTTGNGGAFGQGTIFVVKTNGGGFLTLHDFTATSSTDHTNSDGATPFGVLALSDNTLFGTTERAGSAGNGTVFSVGTDGTGFSVLHSFTPNTTVPFTNSDGANSYAGPVLIGDTLYGVSQSGGASRNGTLFAVNTNGANFRTLHDFTATASSFPYTNSDGARPNCVLASGNVVYGTASSGGAGGNGCVFSINTDGTDFKILYSFSRYLSGPPYINEDGAIPAGVLSFSGGTLYGATTVGGNFGLGTVFSLSVTPAAVLSVAMVETNVILSWPLTSPALSLQTKTNLASGTSWSPVSQTAVLSNGTYFLTNSVDDAARFYRLAP